MQQPHGPYSLPVIAYLKTDTRPSRVAPTPPPPRSQINLTTDNYYVRRPSDRCAALLFFQKKICLVGHDASRYLTAPTCPRLPLFTFLFERSSSPSIGVKTVLTHARDYLYAYHHLRRCDSWTRGATARSAFSAPKAPKREKKRRGTYPPEQTETRNRSGRESLLRSPPFYLHAISPYDSCLSTETFKYPTEPNPPALSTTTLFLMNHFLGDLRLSPSRKNQTACFYCSGVSYRLYSNNPNIRPSHHHLSKGKRIMSSVFTHCAGR